MSQRTLSENSSFLTIHLASLSHSLVFLARRTGQYFETVRLSEVCSPPVNTDAVLGHLVFTLLKIVDDLCEGRRVSVRPGSRHR